MAYLRTISFPFTVQQICDYKTPSNVPTTDPELAFPGVGSSRNTVLGFQMRSSAARVGSDPSVAELDCIMRDQLEAGVASYVWPNMVAIQNAKTKDLKRYSRADLLPWARTLFGQARIFANIGQLSAAAHVHLGAARLFEAAEEFGACLNSAYAAASSGRNLGRRELVRKSFQYAVRIHKENRKYVPPLFRGEHLVELALVQHDAWEFESANRLFEKLDVFYHHLGRGSTAEDRRKIEIAKTRYGRTQAYVQSSVDPMNHARFVNDIVQSPEIAGIRSLVNTSLISEIQIYIDYGLIDKAEEFLCSSKRGGIAAEASFTVRNELGLFEGIHAKRCGNEELAICKLRSSLKAFKRFGIPLPASISGPVIPGELLMRDRNIARIVEGLPRLESVFSEAELAEHASVVLN